MELLPEPTLRRLRYTLRMAGLSLWTFLVYGLWIACWPVGWISRSELRHIRRVLLKLWGAGCLRILNIKLVVEGPKPKPPFFMVANHLGYVDIMILAQQTGTSFVARADMAEWPVVGWMMHHCQMLFIKREDRRDAHRVIGLVKNVYKKGDAFTVFAEGRCGRGEKVHDFKPSLFEAPAREGFPVHCAALSYETPEGESPAGDSVVWWRWEPVEDHLRRMLSLPGFTCTLRYAPAPLVSDSRKVLAQASHAEVTRLFTPVKQGLLEPLPPPEGLPKYLYEE
jgi:1-acyl-sn-glycerol-3-phosphate acyltransferase